MPVKLDAFVESVDGDMFEARFFTPEGKEIWANMNVDMVSDEDRGMISPGSIFTWTLEDDGSMKIVFDRSTITADDITRAQKMASDLIDGIQWSNTTD